MKRHTRSFFGQKTGIIFDSGDYTQESVYLTFIKKLPSEIWEKPSEGQGIKIKLNLGELIMIRRVLMFMDERWSTVHKYNEEQTSISVNRNNPEEEEIWISVDKGKDKDKYSKNLRPPETEILLMLLNHVLEEKIANATVPQAQSNGAGEEDESRTEKKNTPEKQSKVEAKKQEPSKEEPTKDPAKNIKQDTSKKEEGKNDKKTRMQQYYNKTVSF
jgi:hypothetical protein